MKKIGIITIHYGSNYGSALQTCALYKKLYGYGFDVQVINYIPAHYKEREHIGLIVDKKVNIKNFLYKVLTYFKGKKSKQNFDKFYKKNINLSKELLSLEEVKKYCKDFDYLIVGSDQVWNSDYNRGIDPIYYLDFADDKTKKIAYAASCGKNDYLDYEWKKILEYLERFNSISLRESNMVELFRNKGLSCEFVCDPVFLLSKSQWNELACTVKNIPAEYILVYCLDSDKDNLIRMANEIARKMGIKKVLVSYYSVFKNRKVDLHIEGYGPDGFLTLISSASYIVTNSFHGVAFSLLYNKPFTVAKRKKYNSRITSLLKKFGLLERYVEIGKEEIKSYSLDYEDINKNMNDFIKKSNDYLESVLEIK